MGKNRTQEAKRIKYLKQMKARPRFLKMNNGHIKVSQSVDRSKIPQEAVPLFQYRDRAKLNRKYDAEAFLNEVLNTLFPNFNPPMIVEREHEHMRLKVNSLEPVSRKHLLVNGKYRKLAVTSNSELTCVQFIEYQPIPQLLRRSVTYGSYDRAMNVFALETIRWKEVFELGVETTPP